MQQQNKEAITTKIRIRPERRVRETGGGGGGGRGGEKVGEGGRD